MALSLAKAESWVKQHPYETGGIILVVGAVLLYLYYSGGSSASVGTSANSLASQQLAAQVQSEAIQAQYGAQVASAQSQQAAVAAQVNGQLQEAQIAATAQGQQIAAQQTVDLAGISAQQAIQEAAIAGQTQQAKLQASTASSVYGDLFGYLNDQVTQQYGYLNNQVNQGTTVQLAALNNAGLQQEIAGLSQENTALNSKLGAVQAYYNQASGVVTGDPNAALRFSIPTLGSVLAGTGA